jgi:hypothetical protein
LDKRAGHNTNNQTDSTISSDGIISLIEDLKVQINQRQFSPEQIKNLGQISTYLINKVNENFNNTFATGSIEMPPGNLPFTKTKQATLFY